MLLTEEQADTVCQFLGLHNRSLAATSHGITIADAQSPDLPLVYVNDAFLAMSGYSRAELLGQNCRLLQGPERDQPALAELRRAIQTGTHCKVLLRNYRKDGAFFWNELSLSPIHEEATGLLTHFVGIQTDVTPQENAKQALLEKQQQLESALAELRTTQAMLIHAEKMTALGQLVAGVAHEINNPIAFVNSNIHALKQMVTTILTTYTALEEVALSTATPATKTAIAALRTQADLDFLAEDFGDLIDTSLNGLGRVRKIVEELRVFSRLDEADYKLADLREGIQSALLIAQPALKNRIMVELDLASLPPIECRPAELNQVFLNLILNAAQAITDTGQLTITGQDTGSAVVLTFCDTGCGMTPAVMQQIFNPFFTTKPVGVGTGLGLAISYKIITAGHGGTIEVASTLGQGTTFTLRLPKEHHP